MTDVTVELLPLTAKQAAKAGYLVARQNYDDGVQANRYSRHCLLSEQPMIRITPRRDYACLELELPDGRELSPSMAMMILREMKHHRSPGRVRVDYASMEKLPIAAAVQLAQQFVTMLSPKVQDL